MINCQWFSLQFKCMWFHSRIIFALFTSSANNPKLTVMDTWHNSDTQKWLQPTRIHNKTWTAQKLGDTTNYRKTKTFKIQGHHTVLFSEAATQIENLKAHRIQIIFCILRYTHSSWLPKASREYKAHTKCTKKQTHDNTTDEQRHNTLLALEEIGKAKERSVSLLNKAPTNQILVFRLLANQVESFSSHFSTCVALLFLATKMAVDRSDKNSLKCQKSTYFVSNWNGTV